MQQNGQQRWASVTPYPPQQQLGTVHKVPLWELWDPGGADTPVQPEDEELFQEDAAKQACFPRLIQRAEFELNAGGQHVARESAVRARNVSEGCDSY